MSGGMNNLVKKTKDFMSRNPSENEVELFYVNEVLPYTKYSITDLLQTQYDTSKII